MSYFERFPPVLEMVIHFALYDETASSSGGLLSLQSVTHL